MRYYAVFAMLLGLMLSAASCGSAGILTMSDQWCAKHPTAPVSRCGPPQNPAVNVWYRAPKAEPHMANGPAVRDIDPQAIAIPDTSGDE